MSGELTQPKVDQYIHWLSRDDHFGMHGCVYDDKSDKFANATVSRSAGRGSERRINS